MMNKILAGRPPVPQRATAVRWKLFTLIFFLVVINLIDRISLSVGMPVIADEFNLSPAMQGIILSGFFWAYALLQIPAGMLTDKLGSRKIVTLSTLFWGLFQSCTALVTGGVTLLMTRIALGAAEAPLFPAATKLNAIWLADTERGRGAVIMDCGGPLGAAIGGLIIAHLLVWLDSWRAVFIITGIATILISGMAWYYLRDNPAQHPFVNQQELAKIRHGPSFRVTSMPSASQQGFTVMTDTLWPILTGRAAWAMVFFGLLTWGPNYLTQAQHFGLMATGNATFFIFMAGVAGSLSAGFFMDALIKTGMPQSRVLKSLLLVSGFTTLLAFIILPSLNNYWLATVVLAMAVFFLMWGSLYWSLPPLLVSRENVGVIGGIMNMAGSLAGIVVPMIVGIILQITGGYSSVIAFFALCSAVYMLGSGFIRLHNHQENEHV